MRCLLGLGLIVSVLIGCATDSYPSKKNNSKVKKQGEDKKDLSDNNTYNSKLQGKYELVRFYKTNESNILNFELETSCIENGLFVLSDYSFSIMNDDLGCFEEIEQEWTASRSTLNRKVIENYFPAKGNDINYWKMIVERENNFSISDTTSCDLYEFYFGTGWRPQYTFIVTKSNNLIYYDLDRNYVFVFKKIW